MPSPTSAQQLPSQTPNNSAPIALGKLVLGGELTDSRGGAVVGTVELFSYVTAAWRYLFGTFAQTTTAVNPNFSLTAGSAYSQSQLQQLADQVALLSKQLGRMA